MAHTSLMGTESMQIVIDDKDFRRLRPDVQSHILETLLGRLPDAPTAAGKRSPRNIKWRDPVDISADQARRLFKGLSEDQAKRLALFAKKGGRVRMQDILAVTGESDLRATSQFQTAITRRLRRLIDDPERKAQLIAWDFESTKWDASQTTIVDGTYYVSPRTAEALRTCLKSVAA